jgi:hypothetical protein
MARKSRSAPTRPIKTRRDYTGATAVARELSAESERDSAAEVRLQSLLRELDRFDLQEEEADGQDSSDEYGYVGPRRRWSDDASGGE